MNELEMSRTNHYAQPEGPTNRTYNYVLGELWEKKEKNRILKKKKKFQAQSSN